MLRKKESEREEGFVGEREEVRLKIKKKKNNKMHIIRFGVNIRSQPEKGEYGVCSRCRVGVADTLLFWPF